MASLREGWLEKLSVSAPGPLKNWWRSPRFLSCTPTLLTTTQHALNALVYPQAAALHRAGGAQRRAGAFVAERSRGRKRPRTDNQAGRLRLLVSEGHTARVARD